MALSLLPQPRSVKSLPGAFDFKEVDSICLSKRAGTRVKEIAQLLSEELKRLHHLDYQVRSAANLRDPFGAVITHHTREGVYIKTALKQPQAYELVAAGHSLAISATDEGGFFFGTRTLLQLLQEGARILALKIQDWPAMTFRALHLDLKGLTPGAAGLSEILALAAQHKFNALLIEYADRFPYECLPELHGPNAFSPESLRAFLEEARRSGLAVVPLVDLLAQADFVLRGAERRGLAETPEQPRQFCYTNPAAVKLVRQMLEEVLAAHPHSPFVHLGGGKPEPLGGCLGCREAARKVGGKVALVAQQVAKLAHLVKSKGKQVLVWEETLRDAPAALLKPLARDVGLVCRLFQGAGGQFKPEMLAHLAPHREAGFRLFGASAVKGAGPFYSSLPDYRARMDNQDWWCEAAERAPLQGLFALAPARFSIHLTPCDPLPTLWPSALYAAERTWAGLDSSRESFERRMLEEFFGLRAEMAEVPRAFYTAGGGAAEARSALEEGRKQARRNRDILELLELLCALQAVASDRGRWAEEVAAQLSRLEAGCADPAFVHRQRKQIPLLLQEYARLRKELARVLQKQFAPEEIEEFLQDRCLAAERALTWLQELLKRN
jgi:hypothetical protein